MKLTEAIEKGQAVVDTGMYDNWLWEFQALKILIEAGKNVSELRQRFPLMCYGLLPGETEE